MSTDTVCEPKLETFCATVGGCDGDDFTLGTYDSETEVLTVTAKAQVDVPDLGKWGQQMSYHWGASGRELPDTDPDTDSGQCQRLRGTPVHVCVDRQPEHRRL